MAQAQYVNTANTCINCMRPGMMIEELHLHVAQAQYVNTANTCYNCFCPGNETRHDDSGTVFHLYTYGHGAASILCSLHS